MQTQPLVTTSEHSSPRSIEILLVDNGAGNVSISSKALAA
jgi:hypothetical protein